MISNLAFWRNWSPTLKLALAFCSVLALCVLGLSSYWIINGLNNTLHWDVATELHEKFIATDAFVEKGLLFTNNELVYYLKEWYLPSNEQIGILPSIILIGSILIGMSLILSGLSFQNSFWFLAGLVTLALFFIFARTEIIFQSTYNWPFMVGFGLLGILVFLYNSFLKRVGFGGRFSSILAVFVLLLFCAIRFANIDKPLVALSNHSLPFALILFAIFAFFIAHEIVAFFVLAVANASQKGKSSLAAYLGIGIIYLLNCLLIYLENIRVIDGSAMVVSPLVLFLISAILGFWGFRKETEDTGLFNFQRTGAWLYLGLAIISVALLGFVYATSNDPLIELLNDYIAIVHLALGVAFFCHVLINFVGPFKEGLNVYLVLYKPKLSRWLLAKIMSLSLIAFMLIQKNIYSYSQLQAGLNNAQADFYLAEGDKTAAEAFFKESIKTDYYNHKANYALASMARDVGDGITAASYYERALQKNASEFAYIGLSQHLEREDMFFDALFTLREGVSKFPKSAALATNTARILEKAKARDSVYVYAEKALIICALCDVEKVNLQAFWIENARSRKLDSVSSSLGDIKNSSNLANQLAIGRMTGLASSPLKKSPANKALNTTEFAALYNQINLQENEIRVADSTWDALINNPSNISFNEDLRYLKSLQTYQNGNKIAAIKQLTYLAQDSTETGLLYRRTLGMWYLQEGIFDRAVLYFKAAGDAASANVLIENDFEGHLKLKQIQQAGELRQLEINETTYKSLYQQAPLNPFLIADLSDYLTSVKKDYEAYTLVFDALEFNENSVTLWKKYVLLALKNGVPDYAENGLSKLRVLLSKEAYQTFSTVYAAEQKNRLERAKTF